MSMTQNRYIKAFNALPINDITRKKESPETKLMSLRYTNTYYFLCNKFKGQKIVKGETNIMLNLLTYNTSK